MPQTCPYVSTTDLHNELHSKGVDVDVKIYRGKSHTDPIIEDPMQGAEDGMDPLISDILNVVKKHSTKPFKVRARKQKGMLSREVVQFASYFNPF